MLKYHNFVSVWGCTPRPRIWDCLLGQTRTPLLKSLCTGLRLEWYPLPKVEDLFSTLAGGITFTKLDLSQAYQQLVLDDDSKEIVTINTYKGLFSYERLPFGVSSAPGIFQRTMETVLAGVPRVLVYLDDILVTGASQEEHMSNLKEVLSRLQEAGLHLRKDKCEFMISSVIYLGHIIDANGLHPAPDKLKAVRNAPAPHNVTQLKAYLVGLYRYDNSGSIPIQILLYYFRYVDFNQPILFKSPISIIFNRYHSLFESLT